MNLRCFYCQTPFTLSTEEKITALRKMHAEDLHHYDAHCPRCGRANPVSRERLEMFTPGWEAAIKTPATASAGAAAGPASAMPAAPAPSFSPTPAPMMERAEPKTAPVVVAKKEPAKAPARRKHATAAKKATRTAAATKRKPAAKKTAAKKKPVAKAKPKKSAVKAKARKPAKSKAKAKKKK